MKKNKTILSIIFISILFLVILAIFVAVGLDVLISLTIIQSKQMILLRNYLFSFFTPLNIAILIIALLVLFILIYKQKNARDG